MNLNLEAQTSLTSLMEKQHGKVKSENGVNERGLMESTKIGKGNFCCLFLTWTASLFTHVKEKWARSM